MCSLYRIGTILLCLFFGFDALLFGFLLGFDALLLCLFLSLLGFFFSLGIVGVDFAHLVGRWLRHHIIYWRENRLRFLRWFFSLHFRSLFGRAFHRLFAVHWAWLYWLGAVVDHQIRIFRNHRHLWHFLFLDWFLLCRWLGSLLLLLWLLLCMGCGTWAHALCRLAWLWSLLGIVGGCFGHLGFHFLLVFCVEVAEIVFKRAAFAQEQVEVFLADKHRVNQPDILLEVGCRIKHGAITNQFGIIGKALHHQQSHAAEGHLLKVVVAHIERAEIVARQLVEQYVGVDGVGAIHQHKHLWLVGC